MMCSEHTNHLLGYAILVQGEALHAAAWPAFPQYDAATRETRVGVRTRFHAFAGGVPTVCATDVETETLTSAVDDPNPSTDSGTSAIVGPSGEYLTGLKREGEGIVHAEVDLGDQVRSKVTHDVTGHYNRFDFFSLTVDRRPQDPFRFVDGPPVGGDGDVEHMTRRGVDDRPGVRRGLDAVNAEPLPEGQGRHPADGGDGD